MSNFSETVISFSLPTRLPFYLSRTYEAHRCAIETRECYVSTPMPVGARGNTQKNENRVGSLPANNQFNSNNDLYISRDWLQRSTIKLTYTYITRTLCAPYDHTVWKARNESHELRGESIREPGLYDFLSICAWQDSGLARGSLLRSFGASERTLTGLLPPSVGLSAHSPEYALQIFRMKRLRGYEVMGWWGCGIIWFWMYDTQVQDFEVILLLTLHSRFSAVFVGFPRVESLWH